MKHLIKGIFLSAFVLFAAAMVSSTYAQTTEFTYQGKLSEAGGLAASYDFEFRLCSSESSCSSPLAVMQRSNVTVSSTGNFTVGLDFGAVNFNGADRFIEIHVRRAGGTTYTVLAPRQKLRSVPYAVQATKSDDSNRLGGSLASEFVNTTDPRLDSIRNTTVQQSGVNFNIGGTGSANILNAATQFSLGGDRILGNQGQFNFFAGVNAGAVTTGGANAFFGGSAGRLNSTGNNNSFFGAFSGDKNTIGIYNSFFGASSGDQTSSGQSNSFFGFGSGNQNTFGNSNSFFGTLAGAGNVTGSNNTAIGANTNLSTSSLQFATAIGAGTTVATSNTVVLGRTLDTVQAPGSLSVGGFVGAGTQYRLGGSVFISSGGIADDTYNTYVGLGSNCANANGNQGIGNTILGYGSGAECTTGTNNTIVGYGAGRVGTGTGNTVIGAGARVADGVTVNNSTAIGAFSTVSSSDTIILGRSTATTQIPGRFKVLGGESGGTTVRMPLQTVVSQNSTWGEGIAVNSLHIGNVSQVFINTPLCFQAGIGVANHVTVGRCPSSFARNNLKTNLNNYDGGVEIVTRLQPTSFRWKGNDTGGIGLDPEEVERLDPKLVERNETGELLKVSESALDAVLINAIKEQQKQIDKQAQQINDLKKLVCVANPTASVCKE